MSKVYMVEIPDDGNLVESGNCIVFDAPAQNRTLKRMKSGRLLYSQDEVDSMYTKALAKGCTIAWDLVQKIVKSSGDGGFTCEDLEDIFGTYYALFILRNNTYSEAADKVAKWAARIDQSINFDDVLVSDITGKEALVLCADDERAHMLYTDGSDRILSMRFLKRHYKKMADPIAEILDWTDGCDGDACDIIFDDDPIKDCSACAYDSACPERGDDPCMDCRELSNWEPKEVK